MKLGITNIKYIIQNHILSLPLSYHYPSQKPKEKYIIYIMELSNAPVKTVPFLITPPSILIIHRCTAQALFAAQVVPPSSLCASAYPSLSVEFSFSCPSPLPVFVYSLKNLDVYPFSSRYSLPFFRFRVFSAVILSKAIIVHFPRV